MAEKYKIGYYIDKYGTILPSDTDLGAIAGHDWYVAIKPQFDDMVWLYFNNKELLDIPRFDITDEAQTYANIKKSILIFFKQNDRKYSRLYNIFMADFNPLWNVDGVTGTVSEKKKTGKDTLKNKGDDTVKHTGTVTDTANKGDKNIRSGYEDAADSGIDTTTNEATTFDSGTTYLPTDQSALTHGKTTTTTYHDVTDARTINGTDKTTYNNDDKTEYNSTHETEYNNKDNYVEMVIRQGNIGVTRSDELLLHSAEWYENELADFIKLVVTEVINLLTYRIY